MAPYAFLVNPKNPEADLQRNNAQEAATALGLQLVIVQASSANTIKEAFATLVQRRAAALLIAGDAFFVSQTAQIAELAIRNTIPTSATSREQVERGILMSYGAPVPETFRRSGTYVGRILKGEKPGNLPVQQPTKFEFAINMKTAKTLGLNVPNSTQLLADEVIE